MVQNKKNVMYFCSKFIKGYFHNDSNYVYVYVCVYTNISIKYIIRIILKNIFSKLIYISCITFLCFIHSYTQTHTHKYINISKRYNLFYLSLEINFIK